MKEIRRNTPLATIAPKFGKGDAAAQKFRNAVNAVAQLGNAIQDDGVRQHLLSELQAVMALTTNNDARYERWAKLLENEAQQQLQQIWACLDIIKREAGQ